MLKRNWTIILFILIGFLLYRSILSRASSETILDVYFSSALLLIYLIILLLNFIKDFKNYKIQKSWKNYFSSIIGVLILLICGLLLYNQSLSNSPTIIHAYHDDMETGSWFEFKKDGTYKFGSKMPLGATYKYGKYSMQDSIITLDNSTIDNIIISNKLAIRNVKLNEQQTKKLIYQINDKHQIVDKDKCFVVSIYNVKK